MNKKNVIRDASDWVVLLMFPLMPATNIYFILLPCSTDIYPYKIFAGLITVPQIILIITSLVWAFILSAKSEEDESLGPIELLLISAGLELLLIIVIVIVFVGWLATTISRFHIPSFMLGGLVTCLVTFLIRKKQGDSHEEDREDYQ